MNRIGIYFIAALFALVIVLFTCTFNVRFNENAILTTFGHAGDNAEITEPGLHLKWPYPIQSVRKYDNRMRVLQTRIENVVTKDNQLVAVQVFLTWKISDVLVYFRKSENDARAQTYLSDRLRSNIGVFNDFDFGELLTQTGGSDKMSEAEQRMLDLLLNPNDESPGAETYGIHPQAIGITRFILPEKTSTAVFERMKQTRNRLAADIKSSGMAEAGRIRTKATTTAQIIRDFADRRAAAIKAVGEREAASYLAKQADLDENFAIFLRRLEAMETMVSDGTTFVFPAVWPFNLFVEPPSDSSDKRSASLPMVGENP